MKERGGISVTFDLDGDSIPINEMPMKEIRVSSKEELLPLKSAIEEGIMRFFSRYYENMSCHVGNLRITSRSLPMNPFDIIGGDNQKPPSDSGFVG